MPVIFLFVEYDSGQHAPAGPVGEQLMTIRTVDQDDAIILAVAGQVDGLRFPRLRRELSAAFGRLKGRALVVDLTNVSFSSAPLGWVPLLTAPRKRSAVTVSKSCASSSTTLVR